MNRRSCILIFSTLLLLGFGVYFLGLLNPNQLMLKVPGEGTPPADFDVVFGQYKIDALKPDTLKHIKTENCCISITDKESFLKIWDGYYDHYYIVDVEMTGVIKEGTHSEYCYPLFKIIKWKKVLDIFVWAYLFIVSILSMATIGNLIKLQKGKSKSK